MESPGEHLKREREQRGVSLARIFESTRVPMKYLEAIEADRIEGLPHPAFVKGFIRSYCKVLGLDDNDAVLRYEVWLADMNAEAEGAGKAAQAQEARHKAAAPERPIVRLHPYMGKLIVAVVGIIIVVLAYSLTRRDLSAPEPQTLAPAPATEPLSQPAVEPSTVSPAASVPMQMPSPAEPSVPLSTVFPDRASQSVQPAAPLAPPAVPAMTLPAHKSVPEPVSKPAAPVTQPLEQPIQKSPIAEPVKKEVPPPVKAAAPEEQAKAAHTLVVSARESVWLKVGVDRQSPVEVLLKKGERFTWKAAESISVIIGNAGGVSVNYNGREMAPLGSAGEVVGLNLPTGGSYKIKKQQAPVTALPALPLAAPAPQQPPAINMPEIPAAPQAVPAE
ncbi:MAG: DUF4115 domain-containing protein [Deltaproteobacteria bacterium]|nr:DUF4115 domain-containing protein [Deltaproteobacteria bacterium]